MVSFHGSLQIGRQNSKRQGFQVGNVRKRRMEPEAEKRKFNMRERSSFIQRWIKHLFCTYSVSLI